MCIVKLEGFTETGSTPCYCYCNDEVVPDESQNSILKTSTRYDEAAEEILVHIFGMDYASVRMPLITNVFYNEPYTIVKWSDNTVTKASATENEPFNKEIGLSMAISKKVFESFGCVYPRAAFKSTVRNAHDQTEKTQKRKEYKARHKKNK